MKASLIRNVIFLTVIGLLIFSFMNFFAEKKDNIQQTTVSDIANQVNEGKIEKIDLQDNKITAQVKGDGQLQAYKESGIGLKDYGITSDKVQIDVANPDKGSFWPTFLSIVLPFLLIGGFLFFMLRSAQGANVRALSFGKSQARVFTGMRKVVFDDVAGLKEAKEELYEVVEFLRHPEKFRRLGAEIPKGVLLVGPTGTGKTLLAKAVAGEAGVPFFSISASEFVEMFVGVGAARVRDLFQKAKRNSPAILFIDELDAVGRQRGAGLGGSHDEREQTLNQILVEMDGFETDTRVIVMAATNRPDVLDPALLRPGRFDRRIVVDLPDKKDRAEILKIHTKGKPLDKDVSLELIAAATAGFSGADLKNLCNEAAILAARKNRSTVLQADLDEAIEKVMLGPERKSRVVSKQEKGISAYHEAGHATIGQALPNCDPVTKVSVVSRGMALGYTWSRPAEDKYLYSKSKFEDDIAQLLGGRVAEKLIFRQVTTGAQNDLKRATKIAHDMVTQYGMSDKIGPVTLGEKEELVFLGRELGEHKTYSEKIASQIDDEVFQIVFQAEQRAIEILKKYKAILKKLAEKLIKEETVESRELESLFKGVKLVKV
ncbi:MAG: cell division protein FtsH [Candidatus Nealsonbacteria bacterium CG10_big_fil_rev_8_21_14_0_10_40_24]|nr:MAG: cell division protein FtsH [Candidatus Nealsonbacteria bacterium CG10_big_fil_rev_8_21_14_0_10_40_24]